MTDDSMIDDRTVAHVARLSRLELSAEEHERFRDQLGEILAYVRRLDALDLSDVPPTAHVRPMANVLRDDEVRPSLTQAEALANAPAVEQGYFVVPPVITLDTPDRAVDPGGGGSEAPRFDAFGRTLDRAVDPDGGGSEAPE